MPNRRADGQVVSSFAAPRELLERAREKAAAEGRSLGAVVRDLLERWLA